jgi:diguanylate cyclase (GGDEF)-like protein/PAS domain S-box-containing protein
MVMADKHGYIEYVNPAFCQLSGYREDEVTGLDKPVWELLTDSEVLRGNLLDVVVSGGVWKGEVSNRKKDGSEFIAELTVATILGEKGGIKGYVALQRDITHQKFMIETERHWAETLQARVHERTQSLRESLRELEKSKERFELAIQGTNDGIWDWNIGEGSVFMSPHWKDMLGYSESEINDSFVAWRDLVHPDDLGRMLDKWAACMEGESDQFNIEYRIQKKDGSWLPIQCRGVAIRNEKGVPVRMAGCHTDITDRRRNEQLMLQYQKDLQAQVADRTEKLAHANKKLKALASLDELTGVANRRALGRALNREWARCRRNGRPVSVLMIDVDNFKQYNDSYGHIEGDNCLRRIAQTVCSCVSRPADLLGRYGGEEFVVLLTDTDATGASKVAETICDKLRREAIAIPAGGVVTVSIGVASCIPEQGAQVDSLLSHADTALYSAKRGGRDRCVVYTERTDRVSA